MIMFAPLMILMKQQEEQWLKCSNYPLSFSLSEGQWPTFSKSWEKGQLNKSSSVDLQDEQREMHFFIRQSGHVW